MNKKKDKPFLFCTELDSCDIQHIFRPRDLLMEEDGFQLVTHDKRKGKQRNRKFAKPSDIQTTPEPIADVHAFKRYSAIQMKAFHSNENCTLHPSSLYCPTFYLV